MELVHGLENWRKEDRPLVAALGNFDGLHLGHQEVISRAVSRAASLGAYAAVISFHPHPRRLLDPCGAPRLLTTLREKVAFLEQLGIDRLVLIRFTSAFRRLTAREFVIEVLQKRLHTIEAFVGYDHRFGAEAQGDADNLQILGKEAGLQTTVVPAVEIDGGPVSSTRIRRLLQSADMKGAARLLGRWPRLEGVVTPGAGRGSGLGFPTANLYLPPDLVVPAFGVYLVRAHFNGQVYPGLANLGCCPTFGGKEVRVEVHLLGFSGCLYGMRTRVEFQGFLRPEMAFPTPEALRQQVRRDLELAARRWNAAETARAPDSK